MKCAFCNKEIERGTGMKFVRKDGKVINFCSKKCEINQLVLKRNPNKRKWSKKN